MLQVGIFDLNSDDPLKLSTIVHEVVVRRLSKGKNLTTDNEGKIKCKKIKLQTDIIVKKCLKLVHQNDTHVDSITTIHETFYFPSPFSHRPFTVHFAFVWSAFSVCSRSPFTKRLAFALGACIYHLLSVQGSFSVQFALSFGS